MKFAPLMHTLAHFPWRNTAWALRQRFREDRLSLTASSLTFTTVLALVPLLTVALAVFTAFPMFGTLQTVLQKWLVDSLVPDSISRQVLGYLTQFSSKASKLGLVGLLVVLGTALALLLTIDRTLNAIWRVQRPRPLMQRVLVYWGTLTLGPVLLAVALAVSLFLQTLTRGALSPLGQWLGDAFEFAALAAGASLLLRYVPNAPVRGAHAAAGGLFIAVGIELARQVLAAYLKAVPTYSAVYGAFATLPILLVWIYLVWVIVLLGAVFTAYLPSLLSGVARRGGTPGWQFQLALELLQRLYAARGEPHAGVLLHTLAPALRVETVQLTPVLEHLLALDWIAVTEATEQAPQPRVLLLVAPEHTPIAPLARRLLLHDAASLKNLWENCRFGTMRLIDAL